MDSSSHLPTNCFGYGIKKVGLRLQKLVNQHLPARQKLLLRAQALSILFLCFGTVSALAQRAAPPAAPNTNIGDIAFDPATDRSSFQRCGEGQYDVPQYYQSQTAYTGGTQALRQHFLRATLPRSTGTQEGYITIRFLINCHGETDRFRVMQIDKAYQPAHFSPTLVAALMGQTKGLHAWLPGKFSDPGAHHGEALDSYYYLLLKISHGRVVDVLP